MQFGEGGAGTFSDGKLYSQVKDPKHYGRKVMSEFVAAGAPDEIMYVSKPHIGTFRLTGVVSAMRELPGRGGGISEPDWPDILVALDQLNCIAGWSLCARETIFIMRKRSKAETMCKTEPRILKPIAACTTSKSSVAKPVSCVRKAAKAAQFPNSQQAHQMRMDDGSFASPTGAP